MGGTTRRGRERITYGDEEKNRKKSEEKEKKGKKRKQPKYK
jgi:hypothetical protein